MLNSGRLGIKCVKRCRSVLIVSKLCLLCQCIYYNSLNVCYKIHVHCKLCQCTCIYNVHVHVHCIYLHVYHAYYAVYK